jgi:hypothetical protein
MLDDLRIAVSDEAVSDYQSQGIGAQRASDAASVESGSVSERKNCETIPYLNPYR